MDKNKKTEIEAKDKNKETEVQAKDKKKETEIQAKDKNKKTETQAKDKNKKTETQAKDKNKETEIQAKYKELKQLLLQHEDMRLKSNANLTAIARAKEPTKVAEKSTDCLKSKMKDLYQRAIHGAESEREILQNSLFLIREIQMLSCAKLTNEKSKEKNGLMKFITCDAATLPLWVGKKKENPPPLCGNHPPENDYVAKVGDKVAAFSKKLDVWILAQVASYNTDTNEYEVEDVDEVEEKYILSRKDVIPLPLMRVNPETNPNALYPKGTLVLALFPETTSFYKALIDELPSNAKDSYRVLFEDNNYESGYAPPMSVAQRYVVAYDDTKEKKN